jgi:hypothetical protein
MRMVDSQAAWTVVRRKKIVERSRRKRFMVSFDLHDVVVFMAYSASVCIDCTEWKVDGRGCGLLRLEKLYGWRFGNDHNTTHRPSVMSVNISTMISYIVSVNGEICLGSHDRSLSSLLFGNFSVFDVKCISKLPVAALAVRECCHTNLIRQKMSGRHPSRKRKYYLLQDSGSLVKDLIPSIAEICRSMCLKPAILDTSYMTE